MATNEIYPFGAGGSVEDSDVMTLAAYEADTQRIDGHQVGLARRELMNTTLRQVSHMAAGLARFIANRYEPGVLDDGDLAKVEAGLEQVINGLLDSHAARTDNPHAVTLAQAVAAENLLNKAVEEQFVPIAGSTAADIDLTVRNRFVRELTAPYEFPVLSLDFQSEWFFHVYPNGEALTLAAGWAGKVDGEPDSDASLVRLILFNDGIKTGLLVHNIKFGS